MRRVLELAGKAAGRTSPNPMVGAVIVKNGRVIAEGYHKKAGRSHAEIETLRKAGKRARGAQMFVNLEPCCHQGRTPPCTDVIIEPKLDDLLDDAAWRISDWQGRKLWFYEFDEGTLWGATASMVREYRSYSSSR